MFVAYHVNTISLFFFFYIAKLTWKMVSSLELILFVHKIKMNSRVVKCEFQKFSPKMQEERSSPSHHNTPTPKQSTVMQCKQERICKRTQFWEYYSVSCEDTQEKVIYYLKHDCNQSDSIVIRQLSISLSGMDRLIHQGMRWLPSIRIYTAT